MPLKFQRRFWIWTLMGLINESPPLGVGQRANLNAQFATGEDLRPKAEQRGIKILELPLPE